MRPAGFAPGPFHLAQLFLRFTPRLLRRLQRFTPFGEKRFDFGQAGRLLRHGGLRLVATLGERGLFRLQRFDPQLKVPLLKFQPGQFLLLPLEEPFLGKLLLLDLGPLRLDVPDPGGEHLQGFLLGVEALPGLAPQPREIIDLCVQVGQLLLAHADFFLRAGDFLAGLVAQAGEFLHPRAIRRRPLLGPFEGVAQGRVLVAQADQFGLDHREIVPGRAHVLLLAGHFRIELLLLVARAVDLGLQRRDRHGKGVELVPPETVFQRGQFVEARLVAARLARLPLQRADLPFHLADDVGEADQVGLGVFEFAQGLLFLALVLRDPGGFLENRAAVFGTRRENLVDLALFHDRIGRAPDAGVHEEAVNVAQAARRLVDLVLARAVAEDAPRDRHFVVGDAQFLLAIAERERHLGHAERGARFGAGKDDVLHFAAPKRLGRLLAEHPADAVQDVALAAAVGPDNGGDSRVKFERGAVRERFKSDDVERLQVHAAFLRPPAHP